MREYVLYYAVSEKKAEPVVLIQRLNRELFSEVRKLKEKQNR